jgi:hypothetical protein
MKTANEILQYLPKYNGNVELITNNQSVEDIMDAMKSFHEKFSKDYDKVAPYFMGRNDWETAENIFLFLKKNCSYYIEGLEGQTVRNPSAILATGKIDGIDCKNYALFIGGILDAINRTGQLKIPFAYRFAQTDFFEDYYNHVFIVVHPGTSKEFFIDPIPEVKKMDDRFAIYSFKDKKFQSMLYGVSGTQKKIGFTIPGIGVDTEDVGDILNVATKFFEKRADPQDWRGWDEQDRQLGQFVGSSVRGWVLNDGDNIQNEAVNIASYIKANGLQNLTNSGHPTTVEGKGWRDVTIDEIDNKLTRAGFFDEAKEIATAARNPRSNNSSMTVPTNPGSGNEGGSNNTLMYILGAAVVTKLLKIW